jgi:hypothetical protein
LLVVEEAFTTRGRGVVVLPKLTVQVAPPAPFPVRLRLPDGRERTSTATYDVAHIRGPHGAFAMLRLLDLTPEEVPVGTEIEAL